MHFCTVEITLCEGGVAYVAMMGLIISMTTVTMLVKHLAFMLLVWPSLEHC